MPSPSTVNGVLHSGAGEKQGVSAQRYRFESNLALQRHVVCIAAGGFEEASYSRLAGFIAEELDIRILAAPLHPNRKKAKA
jgi:hypothetical protein